MTTSNVTREEIDAIKSDIRSINETIKDILNFSNIDDARIATLESRVSPQPAPDAKPLLFGCVAFLYPRGRCSIRTSDDKWYWNSVILSWCEVGNGCVGTNSTEAEAVARFWATNDGKVPPPGGEAEYRSETDPHDETKCRVYRRDNLTMLVENGHIRWVNDAWTPLDPADALAVCRVLNGGA